MRTFQKILHVRSAFASKSEIIRQFFSCYQYLRKDQSKWFKLKQEGSDRHIKENIQFPIEMSLQYQ